MKEETRKSRIVSRGEMKVMSRELDRKVGKFNKRHTMDKKLLESPQVDLDELDF